MTKAKAPAFLLDEAEKPGLLLNHLIFEKRHWVGQALVWTDILLLRKGIDAMVWKDTRLDIFVMGARYVFSPCGTC